MSQPAKQRVFAKAKQIPFFLRSRYYYSHRVDRAKRTVEKLEDVKNLKVQALEAHPFECVAFYRQLGGGPTFLCSIFQLGPMGGSDNELLRVIAATDAFSKELTRMYRIFSRRQILRHIQVYLFVFLFFAVPTCVACGWVPQGWTAFCCLLVIFFELFLLICAPGWNVIDTVDDKVKHLQGCLCRLEETHIKLKESVNEGDAHTIDAILQNEGHRKLSQLSVKFRPQVNGA
ncbi:hypothetical protein FB45DRAFT_949260 [Roridomyces roridus]|uniref:Uncharacterized protein n=1 Tax=Roridomyces roridus TaxID=1738132 RepID=A0AAD7B170_9AGAR|nr:hypothetical protein FB45DRAFT_949260 [Roridomyces roridus]